MCEYIILKELGRGTYGVVFKAYKKLQGIDVAIKQICKTGESSNRELEILSLLKKNDFIVKVLDVFYSQTMHLSQFIVFEYIPYTLRDFISNSYAKKSSLAYSASVNFITHSILEGLAYIHSLDIVHRDLKPENILVNDFESPSVVKIADFGCAKILNDSNNPFVVTRFYRAPELLFGETHYGKSIDLWATGCILLEMFEGKPIFHADTDELIFEKQIEILGMPSDEDIRLFAHIAQFDAKKLKTRVKKIKHRPKVFDTRLAGIQLALCMLQWDPNKRVTAKEGLCHTYFSDFS